MEHDWEVPKIKLLKFDTVADRVQKFEDLRIDPDYVEPKGRGVDKDDDPGWDVVNLQKVRFTSAGTVQVPGFGLLQMNSWSRRQLGNELGVKWDKFFGDMPPDKINRAVTDHLKTRENPALKKIVARNLMKSEGNIAADGMLRGLVSPTYSEIRDSRLLDRLEHIMGKGQLKDMAFAKHRSTDMGTHFVLVYKDQVNMLAAGKIARRVGEEAFYGLRMRNSEVGAYSLTGDGYFLRVICTNGMIVGVEGARWLHRRHRFIDNENLDKLLDDMVKQLPKSRDEIIANNRKLHAIKLDEPETVIRSFLARKQQPKVVQEAAVKAYEQEPTATAYGALQAISRLGMSIRRNAERNYDIELLAGAYLNETVKEAA